MTAPANRKRDDAFASVFAWASRAGERGEALSKVHASHIQALTLFFGAGSYGCVLQGDLQAYRTWRTGTYAIATRRPYSEALANEELRYCRRLVTDYAAANDLPQPAAWTMARPTRRFRHLVHTREEIVRLLKASHHRRWDAATGRMLFAPAPNNRRRRDLVSTKRYVLLAALSGISVSCAVRLRWSPDPDGNVSYVDLEAGTLHRLGPDTPNFGKFAGHPVILPRFLLRVMRSWRHHDRRAGCDLVVHAAEKVASNTWQLETSLRYLRTRAGVPNVTASSLIDTCAATALQRGAPMFGVAMMLGLEPASARARYDHFRHDAHERALRALDRPLTRSGLQGSR